MFNSSAPSLFPKLFGHIIPACLTKPLQLLGTVLVYDMHACVVSITSLTCIQLGKLWNVL